MAWKFFNSSGQEIVSDTVADGSITFAKMAANSINSDQYVDGSIDGVHIANDVIDSQHYAAASIDNEHLADNAVDSAELAAGSVDIAHLSASGSASSSTFLAGNNAWAAAGSLQSTVRSESRTASASTGSVSYTGAGFAPTAAIAFAHNSDDDDAMSWGFFDDGPTAMSQRVTGTNSNHNIGIADDEVISIFDSGVSNGQSGRAGSFDSDGITIAWTKAGSGRAIQFVIMYLR